MENFTSQETSQKIRLQIELMKRLGFANRETMSSEQRMAGGMRWAEEVVCEGKTMAALFDEICHSSEIRSQLLGDITETLINQVEDKLRQFMPSEGTFEIHHAA